MFIGFQKCILHSNRFFLKSNHSFSCKCRDSNWKMNLTIKVFANSPFWSILKPLQLCIYRGSHQSLSEKKKPGFKTYLVEKVWKQNFFFRSHKCCGEKYDIKNSIILLWSSGHRSWYIYCNNQSRFSILHWILSSRKCPPSPCGQLVVKLQAVEVLCA